MLWQVTENSLRDLDCIAGTSKLGNLVGAKELAICRAFEVESSARNLKKLGMPQGLIIFGSLQVLKLKKNQLPHLRVLQSWRANGAWQVEFLAETTGNPRARLELQPPRGDPEPGGLAQAGGALVGPQQDQRAFAGGEQCKGPGLRSHLRMGLRRSLRC